MAKSDLISRKALLKDLRKELRECQADANEFGGENILWAEGIEFAIDSVKDAKSVDAVEVAHGRWEDVCEIKSFKHTNIPVVECSNCEMRFCDIINNHHFMYHYCPNCGAKMDGGNEDG